MSNFEIQRLKVLAAGIFSLILTLGVARFAYTPMLPLMQEQAGLGLSEGGWLASINYVGYLCGAILASQISNLHFKDQLYRVGLLIAVGSTVGMGLTENVWLWSALRFVAGLSSAAGLLLGSGLIMNWLIRHGHRSELGIHFGGLGLGIAICSIAVHLSTEYLDWAQQWIWLSILGTLLLIPAWRWLPPPDTGEVRSAKVMQDSPPNKIFLHIFMLSYFFAGVGYVISATFLVAIVEALPGLQGSGAWVFMVVGIGAAPACIFWDLVARRIGDLNALFAASVLQIVGILLPVLFVGLIPAILGAWLFGATFIGVVSLVLTMAGRYYPSRPAKMMGKMTISYGVAQIVAPWLIGRMAENSGTYNDGLYFAAAAVAISAALILVLKLIQGRERAL